MKKYYNAVSSSPFQYLLLPLWSLDPKMHCWCDKGNTHFTRKQTICKESGVRCSKAFNICLGAGYYGNILVETQIKGAIYCSLCMFVKKKKRQKKYYKTLSTKENTQKIINQLTNVKHFDVLLSSRHITFTVSWFQFKICTNPLPVVSSSN